VSDIAPFFRDLDIFLFISSFYLHISFLLIKKLKKNLINNLELILRYEERTKVGVKIKNPSIGINIGLLAMNSTDVLFKAYPTKTTSENHNSVKIFTIVVKDHRKSLLIIVPEATT
jgi:hypothetical protein